MPGDKGPAFKPQLLVCYLCGQQFGTSSLSIHIPQCYEKRTKQWQAGDPATRGPRPKHPDTVDTSQPTKGQTKEDFNEQQFEQFTQNLSQCENCGRKFLPDRLVVHQRSCRPGASGGGSRPPPGKPSTLSPQSGGEPPRPRTSGSPAAPERGKGPAFKPSFLVCYLCGQQFGTSSLTIHIPQCYEKKTKQWQAGDPATRGPRPKHPDTVDTSQPTKGQTKEDFNDQQFEQFTQNLSQCENCGRKFLPDRLVVHQRSCRPGASGGGSRPPPGKPSTLSPQSGGEPPRPRTSGSPGAERGKGPAFKPSFLVCYLCGQQFGTSSLTIHIPQCYEKRTKQWQAGDPATRGPRPKHPDTVDTSQPTEGQTKEDFNDQQFEQFTQNLSPCENCGRKFLPDRLVVHQRSCRPGASGGGSRPPPGKPSTLSPQSGGEPPRPRTSGSPAAPERGKGPAFKPSFLVCYLCGQQFGTSSLTIHIPQCYEKRTKQWQAGDPATRGPRPKHPDTVDTSQPTEGQTKEDFNDQQFEQFTQNLSPCENCGRKFLPDRLVVHQRSCRPGASGGGSRPPPAKPSTLSPQSGGEPPRARTSGGQGMSRDGPSKDDAEVEELPGELVPCENCGRKFLADRLLVHQRSCFRGATHGGSKPPPQRRVGASGASSTGPTSSSDHDPAQKRQMQPQQKDPATTVHPKLAPRLRALQKILFDDCDLNKDGKIDLNELRTMVREIEGPSQHLEQDINTLMDSLDLNKDGVIDRGEWEHMKMLKTGAGASSANPITNRLPVNGTVSSKGRECPKCRAVEHDANARFCSSCGAKLLSSGSSTCPECGAPVEEEGSAFCANCGHKFPTTEEEGGGGEHMEFFDCPACGYSCDSSCQFCDGCGVQLPSSSNANGSTATATSQGRDENGSSNINRDRVCAECGEVFPYDVKFCEECGEELHDMTDEVAERLTVHYQEENEKELRDELQRQHKQQQQQQEEQGGRSTWEKKPPQHSPQKQQQQQGPGAARASFPQVTEDQEYDDDAHGGEEERVQCQTCGRCFNPDAIVRHERSCGAKRSRPVFNTKKQRLDALDVDKIPRATTSPSRQSRQEQKADAWRAKSEDFRNAMKAAREVDKVLKSGGDVRNLPPPTYSENAHYVQCPHCSRRFAPDVADRHIPKCQNTVNKPKAPPKRRY